MTNKAFYIALGAAASLLAFSSHACTLTMGYRTNERPPLIAKSPDNSGLYQHFYQVVANKIGCELDIVRGPKKRILKQLQDGEIDFYPGFNFNDQRAEFTFFIANGFPGGEIGISRSDFPLITALEQLEGYTILQALGSPDFVRDLESVKIYAVPEMTIDKAVGLLRKNRGDFYIYNGASIRHYLKTNSSNDIKVHPNCCGDVNPIYLGFSRHSPHFKEVENPSYRNDKPKGPYNFPTQLDSDSKAYQMKQVLEQMALDGETESIYQQYY
ncbi:substrate-binding periplasmic protein [Vibrio sp. TRT 1302]|uniref:substrate-binding periplasmic protein n=1 Tax=Vibrio sp. TRT 1302 TaxID=3418504 RepID=UPI003CEE2FEB